jgi:type IV pilus assembly protein PilY1
MDLSRLYQKNNKGRWLYSMKKIAIFILFIYSGILGIAESAMTDYCITPAFNMTMTKPNIMIVMDFSGSMQFTAYLNCTFYDYDGYVAMCQMPSSGTSNYDSTKTYYGFADTTKYYIYQSSGFEVNTSCSYSNKIGGVNCISGNILNWITSTRVDVARKVLTGGRTSSGASDKFESEGANFKKWNGSSYVADSYTDNILHCSFNITASTTSNRKLNIANEPGQTCTLGTLSDATINIKMQSASEATGIVHDFYDKVHFEFMVYSTGTGAYDRQGVIKSGKDGTLSSVVTAINNETPFWGTPTGEALWEAYDYFKQSNDHSYAANNDAINSTNGNKDPFYDGTGTPGTAIPCRKAFVLLISDGAYGTSIDPVEPARTMRITDLRSDLTGTQNVTTYAVHAFSSGDTTGSQSLKTVAMFGGFDDNDSSTWPYTFTGYPSDSRTVTYPLTNCNPAGTWNSSCSEWDKNKTGLPYNFFEADDGDELKTSLTNALNDMMRRASSGTAASVLASSEGSGANLLQAVYYPKRLFTNTEIEWTGEIQNLWYYIDPYLQNPSIREDTNLSGASGVGILNLTDDYVIKFYFDSTDNKTKAKRYSTDSTGTTETYVDTVSLEDLEVLWEAGTLLFQRNLSTSPRTIYTTINGTSFLTNNFSTTNKTTLAPYLQASTTDSGAEAEKIINYVHGTDQTGYRSRAVTYLGTSGVWKLGDVVDSTPRLQSSIPANNYHLKAPDGYSDSTYLEYIQDSTYLNRGMVYAGANDGMLHAFKLGKLEQTWTSPAQGANEKARLTGSDRGSESWAFIPKNSLPYLKYTADTTYCHLFFVDLPPLVIDTSAPSGTGSDISTASKTKSSWKTFVIGGMNMGGANKISTDSCTTGTTSGTCVKTPTTDPSDSTKGLGYSSYFALNVTDPASPSLLWEFSDPDLGFSTSGPAIVRIGDTDKNAKWFAVFASGPTGPIYTAKYQFMGTSNQNLKLFVLDLYTGSYSTIDTGITNAFGGSMYNAALDAEKGDTAATGRYSDNVLYFGYTEKDTATSTWTKGGVLRLNTFEDPNPANWKVSTVINNIGPVTSAIAKLQDRKNGVLWLYFGTGRFFYRYDDVADDKTNQRTIYGVMEPCYNKAAKPNSIDNTGTNGCTDSVSPGDLDDQTTSPSTTLASGADGWYIDLTASSGNDGAERVVTDPLAVFSGSVFFTTYIPSTDVCSLGGNTYIWCTYYNTGGPCAGLGGKAITQVSTGAIQELSLSSVFTEKESRRTTAITGMPPKGQGLSVLMGPRPLKKILHIREK